MTDIDVPTWLRPDIRRITGGLGRVRPFALVHDLPPRWDGYPVVWREWESPVVFLCTGTGRGTLHGDRCVSCGSDKSPSISLGTVGTDTSMTRPQVAADIKFRRFGQRRRTTVRLTAFRCPDCGHDQVLDDDGVFWDLDPSDYSDGGSAAESPADPT